MYLGDDGDEIGNDIPMPSTGNTQIQIAGMQIDPTVMIVGIGGLLLFAFKSGTGHKERHNKRISKKITRLRKQMI